jgi:hypothetical protein
MTSLLATGERRLGHRCDASINCARLFQPCRTFATPEHSPTSRHRAVALPGRGPRFSALWTGLARTRAAWLTLADRRPHRCHRRPHITQVPRADRRTRRAADRDHTRGGVHARLESAYRALLDRRRRPPVGPQPPHTDQAMFAAAIAARPDTKRALLPTCPVDRSTPPVAVAQLRRLPSSVPRILVSWSRTVPTASAHPHSVGRSTRTMPQMPCSRAHFRTPVR